MADPTTLVTLRRKLKEIAAIIKLYEQQLNQAKADYVSVNAAIMKSKTTCNSLDIIDLVLRQECLAPAPNVS